MHGECLFFNLLINEIINIKKQLKININVFKT